MTLNDWRLPAALARRIVFGGHGMKIRLWTVVLCLMSAGVATAAETAPPVKMIVTAAFVSERGIGVYKDLAGYLTKKLGRDVSVVSGLSYRESDLLLEQGIIQVGFVCGLPYTQAAALGKQQLVAIPVMATRRGEFPDTPGYEQVPGKYYSYTIVRKDSPLSSWAGLKGGSYAYNEQTSNSGYNMPRYKLVQLGARSWEDWFSRIVVSGSHEESIRLVARGVVDASSVDSMVLDFDRHIGNPDALNVKIIEVLFPGGAGAPPVVISSRADPVLRTALTAALVGMHQEPEGREILSRARLLRFDPPNDHNYDDIRRMARAAHKAGFRDHVPR
jgi:phosphonate transport system substrate-binding protein